MQHMKVIASDKTVPMTLMEILKNKRKFLMLFPLSINKLEEFIGII